MGNTYNIFFSNCCHNGVVKNRIWIQFLNTFGYTELHYPFFGAPFMFLWSPYDDSEMARNGFEDGSMWSATGNTCSGVNKAGFVDSRTYVHGAMN